MSKSDTNPGTAPEAPVTQIGKTVRDIAGVLAHHMGITVVQIPHPENSGEFLPVIARPTGDGSLEIEHLKQYQDAHRSRPERRSGTATVQDLASFIELTKRFKDTDSAIFADNNMTAPKMTAVINYHEAGTMADKKPRFGDHRVLYPFPMSKEWKAWWESNGKVMDQGDFAAFLEDHIVDVIAPPDFVHAEFDGNEADKKLADLMALTEGSFGGPTKLMEISRGLQVNINSAVKNAQSLHSGEVSIIYDEQHVDGAGQPLKVPTLFLIAIPIFDMGAVYRFAVRLRYRTLQGKMKWFYQIHRPDLVFDHAFKEACEKAKTDTSLPLFIGKPEGNS